MPEREPDPTPEQQEELRRLLSEARHEGPVPDDVAVRLERVLEQLAEEGPDPDAADPAAEEVVDLAARRRRVATGLLVAAVAVVAVGVGVGQVVSGDEQASGPTVGSAAASESASESTGDRAADSARPGERNLVPEKEPRAEQFEPAPSEAQDPSDAARRRPVRLSEDRFTEQAARYRREQGLRVEEGQVVDGSLLSSSASFLCPPADWGEGRLVAALYDGAPAVLAYRPPSGDTQVVELIQCGSAEVLRSVVLPRPGR